MTFKDYIQGKRHGKQANQLEREAMNDPFLQDAIDGFDSVQGSHLDVINQLETSIDKRLKKKSFVLKYSLVGIAASIALIIGISLLFNNRPENEVQVAQLTETLKEEILMEETEVGKDVAMKIEKKPSLSKPEINNVQKKKEVKDVVTVVNDDEANIYEAETDNIVQILAEEEIYVNEAISEPAAKVATFDTANNKSKSSAVQKIIEGKVLDEEGQPICGASVFLKNNKNIGTITDIEGKFKLNTNGSSQLEATYIGYETKTVAINDGSNIISLQPSTLALNEVVVVGYGKKQRKSASATESVMNQRTAGVEVKSASETQKFGEEEFKKFLFQNLKKDICSDIDYKLTATFRTDKTGKPYDVEVKNSNCEEFEKEFIRLLDSCPAWTITDRKITLKLSKP